LESLSSNNTCIRSINKKRRLFCIYKDVKGRFAFAYAYKRLSSKTSMDFMKKLKEVVPFPITHIQTDNGSEFYGLLWAYTCTALCQEVW